MGMEGRKMDWNADTWNLFLTCMLFSLFAGLLCDMAMRRYLKETEELHMTAGIGMAVTAVFIGIHGFTPAALRCVLLCYVLILAGAADIATREIPDVFHLLIAMAGLIGFQPVSALAGFLVVPLPFLIAALKTGKIGGGDVKLMAASGFALDDVLGAFDGAFVERFNEAGKEQPSAGAVSGFWLFCGIAARFIRKIRVKLLA